MFKFLCAGPFLHDYGISMTHLLPYIKYYAFKMNLRWGNNIAVLIGKDHQALGDRIEFDSFSITNSGGGYMLDIRFPETRYGIRTWYSSASMFYMFLKYENKRGENIVTVTDILEIKRIDLSDEQKITDFCETKQGLDLEIIALVKDKRKNPEFYTKVFKAWRANRETGKFELIDKKKIRKCSNESYGL